MTLLNKIVEVSWVDSCTNGQWAPPEFHLKESNPTMCRSVGYVLVDEPSRLVLVQNKSLSTGHIADTMSIPRVAVKKIRVLKGGF